MEKLMAKQLSRDGSIDFSTFKRMHNRVRDWLPKDKGLGKPFSQDATAAITEIAAVREQLARAELQLSTAQTALAKASSDLIDARQQAQHFRFQSLHDSLTTLPNRLSIQECLDTFIKDYAKTDFKLAILFIDIDKFKSINDVHGRLIGDEVIQIVSARISHAVRSNDKVGRLGGDEFLCLIANAISADNTARIAKQIYEAVREPIQIGDVRLIINTSIGIAFSPDDGVNSQSLMAKADAAMYRAKKSDSRFEFYDSSMDSHYIG
jgi:diguanylate cyclase